MGSTTSNAIQFEIWNLHVRFEPAPATQDSVDYQVCLYKQYKRLHKNIVGVTCASAPVIMVNVVCCIVCFLLKLRLITTSFTLPVKYSAESSELTPLPEKKDTRAAYFRENLYLLFLIHDHDKVSNYYSRKEAEQRQQRRQYEKGHY